MTENKTSKKPLKKNLTMAFTILAALALVAIFLEAVLRSDKSPTTTPEEMRAKIRELVAQGYEEEITNSIGMKLRLVPPGTFLMGSPDPPSPPMTWVRKIIGPKAGIKEYHDNESPQHEVTITEPFYMGVHKVTQEQYKNVIGRNPSQFRGKNLPVEKVSWDDAVEFCAKLSDIDKTSYSLSTEAQWEYTFRAGSETEYYWGDEFDGRYAWAKSNSAGKTHAIGTREPNALGLYDMSGNVSEWCSDLYEPYNAGSQKNPSGPVFGQAPYKSARVIRGGCWDYGAGYCRSASRNNRTPGSRIANLGFRVVAVRAASK